MSQPSPEPTAPVVVPPTFLPWLRRGLAGSIDTPAVAGLATANTAEVSVTIEAVGEGPGGKERRAVPSPLVRLVGPGEIVGLDQREIVRRDPEPGAADAEPNYFALVELASPDLPWRFTPASPGEGLLQPWLALVVVDEAQGVSLESPSGARLPVLTVDDPDSQLPDLAHCWAWAHVQVDHDLADGVDAALATAPEAFRSRLLCPRRLPPGRSWLACIVPTFAAGRQAGLGEAVTATGPAWTTPASGPVRLPVYHSWRFSTGPRGDFESLVKRLRPRELPGSVGRRDLDVSNPGGGLPAVAGTLLTYQGALLSPAGAPRPWPENHREAMKTALRRAVNQGNQPRASERRAVEPTRPTPPKPPAEAAYDALRDDPVVGPPAHGGPQARRRTVPAEDQPPVWFGDLNTEPPHRSVAGLGAEVVRADQEALMATAWRHAAEIRAVNRTLRRARLAWEVGRKLQARLAVLDDAQLLQLAGSAMARLPHSTAGTVHGAVAASELPEGLFSGAFRRQTRTVRAFTAPGPDGWRLPKTAAFTAAAVAAPAAFAAAWRTPVVVTGTEVEGPLPQLGPLVTSAVATMSGRVEPEARTTQRRRGRTGPVIDTGPVEIPGPSDELPVADLGIQVRAGLDPAGTVKAMVDARIVGLPATRDHDVPARWRADPEFVTPMSERLTVLSVEYVVPGIGVIPDDTLGLLEINQPFVEAFLAGFNHELGREFRWREYPATPEATWARRFWDRAGAADIDPISDWVATAPLGDHPAAEAAGASLVLLLKGALPRRYPDLRVYAAEAAWDDDGKRVERVGGQIRPPVLAGQLQPDTWFWGFELEEAQARGSTQRNQPPGWFFVLEEKPGALRFGLDPPTERTRQKAPGSWSDLRWSHLAAEGEEPLPGFADPSGPTWLADGVKRPGNGGKDAWGEDAAAMARITLQRPVRMLVHADSMLPPPGGTGRPDIDIDLDPFDPRDPGLPGSGRPGPGKSLPQDPGAPEPPDRPSRPGPRGSRRTRSKRSQREGGGTDD